MHIKNQLAVYVGLTNVGTKPAHHIPYNIIGNSGKLGRTTATTFPFFNPDCNEMNEKRVVGLKFVYHYPVPVKEMHQNFDSVYTLGHKYIFDHSIHIPYLNEIHENNTNY
jgi:hypothetical protein